jgi:hypothetical protein
MPSEAERYEQRFPQTGVGESQAQERMQRLDFREEVQTHRRTTRNRGIVVPDCKFFRDQEKGADSGR